MRTPLNSICMGLELISESNPLKSENASTEANILEDVVHSCDSAVNILDELLIFAKLESKCLALNSKRAPVYQFLTEVLEPFIGLVSGYTRLTSDF